MRAFPTFGTLCLLLVTAGTAEAADDWWGRDKALHFGVSAGVAASGYGVSSLVLDERWQRAAAGGSLALALGAGKELYDLGGGGDASWKDFTWDVAGAAVGVGAALLCDLAIGGSRDQTSRPADATLLRF